MEKYNDTIAGNAEIEMIHISLDSDEDSAEEWAAKEGFPWPTVMPDKVERSGLRTYKTTNGVPEYHLVDAEGNTVVAGTHDGTAAFSKIKELAGKESE